MGLREAFQKRIDRKQEEIRNWEMQIREANAYIPALQDAIRIVPRDNPGTPNEHAQKLPRPGTALRSVYEALKKSGKPLHITEILKAIGKPVDKSHRVALSGSLATYVRDRNVFSRPEPNTFGLLELADKSSPQEPPEDFGTDEEPLDADVVELFKE